MKYLKIYLHNYFLIYLILSVFAFFFMFFYQIYSFFVILFLIWYNYFLHKKKKLTIDIFHFNYVISFLSLLVLCICLLLSQGYYTSPFWIPLYIILAPFAPLFFSFQFFGLFIEAFIVILILLFANCLFSFLYLKPKIGYKKMIISFLCIGFLILTTQYAYANRPAVKYKGHDFEYMNGYSSTDLSAFLPYATNSQLITLEEPSQLIIENENDMPYLDGAEACYPVYSAIAKAVYKDIDKIEEHYKSDYSHSNGKIVSFTNTSVGYSRLFNGEIDMFFGAKPSQSQLDEAKDLGVELEYTPIGKEAFVFFVNQNNPLNSLTTQQIKDIYHGDITNWKEVGGDSHDIVAFQRPERSGSQAMMNYFMGDVSLKVPLTYEMQSAMGGIITEVAQYYNEDGAIGYTFKYFLEGLNQEENVKILSVDGIYPTVENIKNQSYPISTFLYCVTLKSNEKENVKKLKEFLLSSQGQYIIEKTGYCGLN